MGKRFSNKIWVMGLLLAVSMTGCGSDGGGRPGTFGNKSSINGRLLAQTAVTLDATTVTVP